MNTTTTAAQESAKNVKIYGLMAEVARKAFKYLTIAPGQYTAPQVVAALKKSRAKWDDLTPGVADPDGLAAIACEGFECKYPLQMAFDVLAQVATAYDIPTADRATFERAAETAPVLLTLDVPTAAREVAKAVSKKDTGTPAITFAYFDTKRRALVGTNRQVLTVTAAPFAEVAPEAADTKGFLIPVSLLRSHRVTIDANNNATDGHKVMESPNWHRWPNWESIFPQVHDTDALTLSKATARELTKAVATAAKFATAETGTNGLTKYVAIFGEAYTDRLTVRARHLVGDRFEYHDVTVRLTADLGRSFALAVSGDDFATLPTFDTLFVPANHRPAIVTSAHAVALIFALTLPEDFATICDTDTPPTWAKVVEPLADLLGVVEPCPLTTDTTEADTIATAATCEAVESVESVAPADTKADTCEAVSEPESEPQGDTLTTDPETIAAEVAESIARENETPEAVASRRPWYTEGRHVVHFDIDRRACLVGTASDWRYISSGEWLADFRHGGQTIIGVPAGELHPATAEPTPEVLRAMKTAAKAETTRPASESETNRATFFLWSQGIRKAGEWFTLRATGEVVARVVLTYGKKTRALDCPCTGARVEPLTWPTPDTCETVAPESVAPAEIIDTPEAVTFGEYCPLTGEYLTDTGDHLTPEELADLVERERERLADTPEADTIATATTCEAVESVAPADTKADTPEAVSEPESEPQSDTLTTDPETVESVTTWASPYAIACELPTADGIESEPTPQADTLTPPPADTIESEGEPVAPVLTIERPRHHWHPRRALRTVLRVAALIVAALLLTLTTDRVETIEADTLTTDPEAVAIADTLTADTIATATTCEVVESVAPADTKADTREAVREPRKRATRHDPDTLAQVATADTIATATTCEAVENVESVAPADTKADTIEAVSEPESEPQGDTLTTDPVSHEGDTLPTPTPATTGTPSPSTPATGGTPAPVPVSPAVLVWLLML